MIDNWPSWEVTPPVPEPNNVSVHTAVAGREGYSVTPDLCTLNIDIRTTPTFDSDAASNLLRHLVAGVDSAWTRTRPTLTQVDTRWPAYSLAEDSRLRTVLDAAHTAGIDIEAKIAGPSNIGNYLAGLGIPATAGFGVTTRHRRTHPASHHPHRPSHLPRCFSRIAQRVTALVFARRYTTGLNASCAY